MRSKFWHGMVLGTLAATALSAFIGPLNTPQKKPLVERGTEADAVLKGEEGLAAPGYLPGYRELGGDFAQEKAESGALDHHLLHGAAKDRVALGV